MVIGGNGTRLLTRHCGCTGVHGVIGNVLPDAIRPVADRISAYRQ
jgi:dihydrodipicolinate synthase/N-acetylneuraminate lyase